MRRVAAVTAIAWVSVAAAAQAADPQVQVDPRSPAQKEYAIPLEQARGVGGTGHSGGGAVSPTAPAPLFGAGVKRDRVRKAASGPGSSSRPAPPSSGGNGAAAIPSAVGAARRAARIEAPAAGAWPLPLLAAFGVLALGAATLLTRRRVSH
jgi:hypothetical protein